jgi:hypothetical protein
VRHVIAEFLKLYPERANGWVADDLGTTNETVSKIREDLESKSKIDFEEVLISRDGRRFGRSPHRRGGHVEHQGQVWYNRSREGESCLNDPKYGLSAS